MFVLNVIFLLLVLYLGQSMPMMIGNVVAIAAGGIICALVSLYTKNQVKLIILIYIYYNM